MYIVTLQEKKDKSKHGLGGLQEGYDMAPHSWIITTMRMVGLADNIIGLIKQSMSKWKTNVYADGKLLGSVPIRRGISSNINEVTRAVLNSLFFFYKKILHTNTHTHTRARARMHACMHTHTHTHTHAKFSLHTFC